MTRTPSHRPAHARSAGRGESGRGRADGARRRGESAGCGTAPDAGGGRYAAIDLGTNTCRLLIAKPSADGFQVVDAFSRIVRLGEGLGATGRLREAAMARALDALGVCRAKIRRHGVRATRAVATAACREAANRDEFLDRVRWRTGLELEVIAPQEEVRLALGGCAPLLEPDVPNGLIFDIGGGSTELCWLKIVPEADGSGAAPELVAWHSMPVGVANLAERFAGQPQGPESFDAMVAEAAQALATFADDATVARAFAGGPVQMVGASGTVTTLAGVAKNLPRYDRRQVDGCRLSADTVRQANRRIARMTQAERAGHPCIGVQRADFVIAGCAILQAICQAWPVERLTVADRGLREGMLYHLMQDDSGAGPGGPVPAPLA